jgi:hypothetical protein
MRVNQLPVSADRLAALVPNVFFNFYLVKNHKIAYNSENTDAREKNKLIFGILRILEIV